MLRVVAPLFLLLLTLLSFTPRPESPPWGFFGHRRINRLAVFTLPAEMSAFYKRHIEFITEHAVDPDKRRYATRHEAVRHYIDVDHWDVFPFEAVPRDWIDALVRYTFLDVVTQAGDTLPLMGPGLHRREGPSIAVEAGLLSGRVDSISYTAYRTFFRDSLLPQYYEEVWTCSCEALPAWLPLPVPGCRELIARDSFSAFGILPYHLLHMQQRLTRAFEEGDTRRILRLSTEMGHYIGDAHVPLHTTENYNGQMTGQDGIHAFWESRLVELFADPEYDFWVGAARYIEDPASYYWEVVLESHQLLDSVLGVERALRHTFPADRQFCYEDRLGMTVRTQCPDYARAYHDRLGGQVEDRMRAAILAVGSAWYTAWVDAGSPDLKNLKSEEQSGLVEEAAPLTQASTVRPHE